jgi:hypothetical protein
MHIPTPTGLASVAWEGELVSPPVAMGGGHPERPRAAIGVPERWQARDVLSADLPGGPPTAPGLHPWTTRSSGCCAWPARCASRRARRASTTPPNRSTCAR